MSARLFCTVECKRIQVGFHRPFATKTSADDVSRKQKGTNEWYIIASPPKVSCSHRQDLTQIYSFIISISVERVFHQMTHVFNEPQSAGTYLYPPQSSWLTALQLDWKHASYEQQNKWTIRLYNNVDFGCKIYKLLLESPREFELIQRKAHVTIGVT